MEGSSNARASSLISSKAPPRMPELTLVLVGKTGNGKSTTGNRILSREAFQAKASSSGITRWCEMYSTDLRDGRKLNVIDTPGFFECSDGFKDSGKEIVKCMDLAKDGIHAVLFVLSVRSPFSRDEEDTLNNLRSLFGEKFLDYMVLVFTGGDWLKHDDETLEDYLGRDCPAPLQDILRRCGRRMVLFDNKSKAEQVRYEQLNKLISLVGLVIENNGGQPYSNEHMAALKNGTPDKKKEDLMKRMAEMMERKMKAHVEGLEKQLAKERAERVKAEKIAREQLVEALAALSEATNAKTKSDDEIRKRNDDIRELREKLEKTQKENAGLRENAGEAARKGCHIL